MKERERCYSFVLSRKTHEARDLFYGIPYEIDGIKTVFDNSSTKLNGRAKFDKVLYDICHPPFECKFLPLIKFASLTLSKIWTPSWGILKLSNIGIKL
jgi:hypothetical protein